MSKINLNFNRVNHLLPSLHDSITHQITCLLANGKDWAIQRFLEDNPDCTIDDCELVSCNDNYLAYYVRKRKNHPKIVARKNVATRMRIDPELYLPPDPKPWEHVVKSTILWIGHQTDFLNWMDVNVPKSRTLQSIQSPDVLKAVESENVYYRVCDDITLRGMQPQMILVHNDSYLSDNQYLEIKGMQTFAHTIFLEDYD